MAEGSEDASTINLTVKTAKDKQQVEVAADASVKQVKARAAGGGLSCRVVGPPERSSGVTGRVSLCIFVPGVGGGRVGVGS